MASHSEYNQKSLQFPTRLILRDLVSDTSLNSSIPRRLAPNKLASLLTLEYTMMPHLRSLHVAVLPGMLVLSSSLTSQGLCPNHDPI